MTEQIPEAWKGQEVEVVYSGPDKTYTEAGILDGLGERGVVLKRAGSDVTRFFPWSSIIYIKHGKDPSGGAAMYIPDEEPPGGGWEPFQG